MRLLLFLTALVFTWPANIYAASAEAVYQQAWQALQGAHPDDVLKLTRHLQQQFPNSTWAEESYYVLGRAWEQKSQPKQALQAYRQFLEYHLNSVHRVDAQLKVSLIRSGLKETNPDSLNMMLQALNQRALSNDANAIAWLKKLLHRYPHSRLADDALNIMAYMQLVDMHDVAAAAISYRSLLKTYPQSNYVDNAMYGLGVALEDAKQWSASKHVFERLKAKHMAVNMLGLGFAKDNYLSRVWFNKATSRLTRLAQHQIMEEKGTAFIHKYGFMLGVGDRVEVDMPVGSGQHYQSLASLSKKFGLHPQSITHWLTRETNWQWETPDRLKALVEAGHTPVIVDWYFGDQISPSFVSQHADEYRRHIREQLIPLIRDLPEVWVLLEPEFNKHGISSWRPWGDLSRDVVDMIHQSVAGARVGFVLGNWTDTQQSSLVDVMSETVQHSDFIGFQEMISSLDAHSAMDVSWNPVDRSLRLASFLQKVFHKPIYLAYLAVSSFGHWQQKQAHLIERFRDAMPELAYHGVIGASYFALFDDPKHVGWFVQAETSLGLVDAYGKAKPALKAWKSWDKLRQKDDHRAPYLLQAAQFSGFPFDVTTGKAAEAYMQSNEWSRWQITIRGLNSHAERVFNGAGSDIHMTWHGLANRGQFSREACQMTLQMVDVKGNQSEQDLLPSCFIMQAYPVQSLYRYPFEDQPEVYHWGNVTSEYQQNQKKTTLKIHLASTPSGLVMPVHDGDSVDINPTTAQAMLQLRVRLQGTTGEGLRVGLEDAQGFHSSVLLLGYMQADSLNVWQDISIPLHDFPALGQKDDAHGQRQQQSINWHTIRQILITSTVTSTSLDMTRFRVIQ